MENLFLDNLIELIVWTLIIVAIITTIINFSIISKHNFVKFN
jgi:hypothetical protein